jgi:hypothetical protein
VLLDSERRWAFWTLLAPTVAGFALPVTVLAESLPSEERAALLQGEPAAGILHSALLLAAPLLWLLLRGNRYIMPRERLIATGALGPVLLLLLWGVIRATDAPVDLRAIAIPASALTVCALALALGTLGSRRYDRLALEAGAALVLVPGTAWLVFVAHPLDWLMLLLAGLAALIVAIAPDGLFGSRSVRRHVGWLALLLGTAGLWRGLDRAGTDALEPYVLPVAGVLLVLAALIRRFGLVDRSVAASPVAALLTLAGLLTAIAPLALATQTGSPVRPLVIAGVSAVLVLGAGVLRWAPPVSAYLAAAGVSGAVGLFSLSIVRLGVVLREAGVALPPGARLGSGRTFERGPRAVTCATTGSRPAEVAAAGARRAAAGPRAHGGPPVTGPASQ